MTFAGNEIFLHAASATLSPNKFIHGNEQDEASNAFDGDNREGSSGSLPRDYIKCAITVFGPLMYFKRKMTQEEKISYLRLHLRDVLKRQRQQNGLTVSVSNSSNIDSATRCSDKVYDALTHGQSPVFVCMNQARYIWVAVRNSP